MCEGAPELRQVLPLTVVLMTRRRGNVTGDCGLTPRGELSSQISLPISLVKFTGVIFSLHLEHVGYLPPQQRGLSVLRKPRKTPDPQTAGASIARGTQRATKEGDAHHLCSLWQQSPTPA